MSNDTTTTTAPTAPIATVPVKKKHTKRNLLIASCLGLAVIGIATSGKSPSSESTVAAPAAVETTAPAPTVIEAPVIEAPVIETPVVEAPVDKSTTVHGAALNEYGMALARVVDGYTNAGGRPNAAELDALTTLMNEFTAATKTVTLYADQFTPTEVDAIIEMNDAAAEIIDVLRDLGPLTSVQSHWDDFSAAFATYLVA